MALKFPYDVKKTLQAISGYFRNLYVDGSAKLGDGGTTDYSEFEANGTLKFNGAATVWDDLRISGSMVRQGAIPPTLAGFGPSGNLRTYQFESGKNEEIEFEIQMPHSWKEGSKIYPHIHWAPISATAGNVVWNLEYAWVNIAGTAGAPATMSTDATAAGGTAWVHKMTYFKDGSANDYIDGTGKTISSMLVCRVYRNAGTGSDTLAANVAFLEVDFHYEQDTTGSRTESGK